MINTWWFNLVVYIILYICFTQSYKFATQKSKDDGALTILLQFCSGIVSFILIPFFKIQFPSAISTYLLLFASCIFYAIADRVNTTARRGLEVSVYSILSQFSTVFVIAWGIIFFKEGIVLQKLLGALLIIIGNIFVLYKKGKFEWNRYVLFSLLGNLTMSIGISLDVGISDQFNLPLYAGITLVLPSLILLVFERVKVKDVINEFKEGDRKAIMVIVITWGIMILAMLRAYQFGSVTTVAPLTAVTTILNVFVSYFALKEKDSILRKIIAAVIVVFGIVLIKI